MNIKPIQNIAHIIRLVRQRTVAFVQNISIFFKRAELKVRIASDKAFLRDAEEDVAKLTAESNSRHQDGSRQDYDRVLTMELDSRMVKAMTELKELKQKVQDMEKKLSSLSYK